MNEDVFEDARVAIVTRLMTFWDSAHPTVPVQYENLNLVDIESQTAPYISCDIVFSDGVTASIGEDPMARYVGAIWLSVMVKEGEGTSLSLQWLGELANLFKAKQFGGVYTSTPRPVPARPHLGWYVQSIRVPFRIHDM